MEALVRFLGISASVADAFLLVAPLFAGAIFAVENFVVEIDIDEKFQGAILAEA